MAEPAALSPTLNQQNHNILASLETKVALQDGRISGIEQSLVEIKSVLQALSGSVSSAGKLSWSMVTGLIGIIFPFVTGVAFIIGLYVDGSVTPLQGSIERLQSALDGSSQISRVNAQAIIDSDKRLQVIAEQSARAEQDRADIKNRMDAYDISRATRQQSVDRQIAAIETLLGSFTSETRAVQTEIDTQIRAMSEIENGRWNGQERINGVLWEKLFGQRYPDRPSWQPNIARGSVTGKAFGG